MYTKSFLREAIFGDVIRMVAASSAAFAVLVPSTQAAPNKAAIDNYARANGFPRSDYPYYENVNGCGGEGWS